MYVMVKDWKSLALPVYTNVPLSLSIVNNYAFIWNKMYFVTYK